MGRFDRAHHGGHSVIEGFGPEDFVIAPAVHDEVADMAGHG